VGGEVAAVEGVVAAVAEMDMSDGKMISAASNLKKKINAFAPNSSGGI
jgi:hypothetical protein